MTKRVCVGNADFGTDYGVVVEVWDKGQAGAPDTKAFEEHLPNPADMTSGSVYLTRTRYLVVREIENTP